MSSSDTIVDTIVDECEVRMWTVDHVRAWATDVLGIKEKHAASMWLEGNQLLIMTTKELREELWEKVPLDAIRKIVFAILNRIWCRMPGRAGPWQLPCLQTPRIWTTEEVQKWAVDVVGISDADATKISIDGRKLAASSGLKIRARLHRCGLCAEAITKVADAHRTGRWNLRVSLPPEDEDYVVQQVRLAVQALEQE